MCCVKLFTKDTYSDEIINVLKISKHGRGDDECTGRTEFVLVTS